MEASRMPRQIEQDVPKIVNVADLPLATEWVKANVPAENLLYRDHFWPQIGFVRDVLAAALAQRTDHTLEEYTNLVRVCGEHHSKSVTLPVFSIAWKRGVTFTLRNNFHDWNVSVDADRPIEWDFDGLFDRRKDNYCFVQGFPPDRVFGRFDENPQRFTFSVSSNYDVYVFFFLLARQFPAKAV
jgi:hypothetical protein